MPAVARPDRPPLSAVILGELNQDIDRTIARLDPQRAVMKAAAEMTPTRVAELRKGMAKTVDGMQDAFGSEIRKYFRKVAENKMSPGEAQQEIQSRLEKKLRAFHGSCRRTTTEKFFEQVAGVLETVKGEVAALTDRTRRLLLGANRLRAAEGQNGRHVERDVPPVPLAVPEKAEASVSAGKAEPQTSSSVAPETVTHRLDILKPEDMELTIQQLRRVAVPRFSVFLNAVADAIPSYRDEISDATAKKISRLAHRLFSNFDAIDFSAELTLDDFRKKLVDAIDIKTFEDRFDELNGAIKPRFEQCVIQALRAEVEKLQTPDDILIFFDRGSDSDVHPPSALETAESLSGKKAGQGDAVPLAQREKEWLRIKTSIMSVKDLSNPRKQSELRVGMNKACAGGIEYRTDDAQIAAAIDEMLRNRIQTGEKVFKAHGPADLPEKHERRVVIGTWETLKKGLYAEIAMNRSRLNPENYRVQHVYVGLIEKLAHELRTSFDYHPDLDEERVRFAIFAHVEQWILQHEEGTLFMKPASVEVRMDTMEEILREKVYFWQKVWFARQAQRAFHECLQKARQGIPRETSIFASYAERRVEFYLQERERLAKLAEEAATRAKEIMPIMKQVPSMPAQTPTVPVTTVPGEGTEMSVADAVPVPVEQQQTPGETQAAAPAFEGIAVEQDAVDKEDVPAAVRRLPTDDEFARSGFIVTRYIRTRGKHRMNKSARRHVRDELRQFFADDTIGTEFVNEMMRRIGAGEVPSPPNVTVSSIVTEADQTASASDSEVCLSPFVAADFPVEIQKEDIAGPGANFLADTPIGGGIASMHLYVQGGESGEAIAGVVDLSVREMTEGNMSLKQVSAPALEALELVREGLRAKIDGYLAKLNPPAESFDQFFELVRTLDRERLELEEEVRDCVEKIQVARVKHLAQKIVGGGELKKREASEMPDILRSLKEGALLLERHRGLTQKIQDWERRVVDAQERVRAMKVAADGAVGDITRVKEYFFGASPIDLFGPDVGALVGAPKVAPDIYGRESQLQREFHSLSEEFQSVREEHANICADPTDYRQYFIDDVVSDVQGAIRLVERRISGSGTGNGVAGGSTGTGTDHDMPDDTGHEPSAGASNAAEQDRGEESDEEYEVSPDIVVTARYGRGRGMKEVPLNELQHRLICLLSYNRKTQNPNSAQGQSVGDLRSYWRALYGTPVPSQSNIRHALDALAFQYKDDEVFPRAPDKFDRQVDGLILRFRKKKGRHGEFTYLSNDNTIQAFDGFPEALRGDDVAERLAQIKKQEAIIFREVREVRIAFLEWASGEGLHADKAVLSQEAERVFAPFYANNPTALQTAIRKVVDGILRKRT